jgi:SRSO17 transposase
MQHLLARASWDADDVRDDVRAHVTGRLADPQAVLVVDETGDVKKGTMSAGVQRQYTGTAGRIENSQVAVYLTYAAAGGHALIDRELYLPASWTDDPGRCRAAGIPEDTGFATKPALALKMITRALDAGVQAAWVTGDEVYGADPDLRKELEERQIGYVLAVACHRTVTAGQRKYRADALAARVPARGWQRCSAGPGAKGHRYYDWALISLDNDSDRPGCRWLLVRRSLSTGELAYYRCYAPSHVSLAILVTIAGRRWTTEENFQAGKTLTGLDEHQVRTWTSWHRWTTLAILASAALTLAAAAERAGPAPPDQIPLTRNEIARLINALVIRPAPDTAPCLHWSRWRRRHQYRARQCHYQRQSARL